MANNFTNDPHCIALYKMESGALTADSKGSNTLTALNTPADDTTNYKEGSCACLFTRADLDALSRTDANLTSGFPLKNGTSNKTISICFWVRIVTLPGSNTMHWWATKYDSGTANKRSFGVAVQDISGVKTFDLVLGYNSGISYEDKPHGTTPVATTWYHITATYQDSDKSYSFRIRDTNGDVVGTDLEGTATLDANGLSLTTAPFAIGCGYSNGGETSFANATIDELVIFDDIITADEATAIAQGVYTAAVTGSTCWGYTQAGETNIRAFTNWTGTGSVENTGDAERIVLLSGQNMESETVNTGAGTVTFTIGKYQSSHTPPYIKYRTGATASACEAASLQDYPGAQGFTSLGYARAYVGA